MSDEPGGTGRRVPLSRERVLRAAMAVADAGGLGSLTIRSLAAELGARPMALYHHIASKEEILDGVVDLVFGEIEVPSTGGDWRLEMRRRTASARQVLGRHPWAIGLLDSRAAPGPTTLRHLDMVLGTLRNAGFSVAMAAHAIALLDSYVYGFVVQEASLAFDGDATVDDVAASVMDQVPADEYPHLVEMVTDHALRPGYDFGQEFDFGLDLILDGLERAAGPTPP